MMVWVVPMARAMFDRCAVVLSGGSTLPEDSTRRESGLFNGSAHR
jgi:hypothetical protein